ncbi:MAG: NTP transferase domain-containing protein [Lachnospiraceae bacterium]|nr:NTP transferase domain-containing protein [Lachnospiraceae bacterium]
MKTGAVILAAGMSTRMGEYKPLLPFENTTIARHVANSLIQAGADPIVVVTGYRGEELEEHLEGMGLTFVRNKEYDKTQMFDSLKLGIEAIADSCEKLLIVPVDTPAISQKTYRQVLMIDADMVRTVYAGHPGHPILLRSRVAKELCAYTGDRGLRGAMEESSYSITNLIVDDKAVNWDVDTQKEYMELIEWNSHRESGYPIHPKVDVRLVRGTDFFCSVLANLLQYIERTGSIQEACQELEISYSKGSKMIKDAEKALGFKLLERWSGGVSGGGSRMTEEAKGFIQCYKEMLTKLQNITDQVFRESFSKF